MADEVVVVGKSPSSTKAKTTFPEEETEKLIRSGVKKKSFSIAAMRTFLKRMPDKMQLIPFCYDWINKVNPWKANMLETS